MAQVALKVITPSRIVIDETVVSVTAPSTEGEITVLPRHQKLFTLLQEGIITIRRSEKDEDFLAIGGGYLETDGKQITILVSRAYGQDEVDQHLVKRAMEDAQKVIHDTKDKQQHAEAYASLRRSQIDMKLLQKRRHRQQPTS